MGEPVIAVEEQPISTEIQGKSPIHGRLKRADSFDAESPGLKRGSQTHSWGAIFNLAFQSIGVVYGDIGTSPLYVYSSTFASSIQHNDDILGVLAIIIYTLILITLIKYVFIVLQANDNGDGGTFALYSLICRYAKVSLIPNQQAEDRDVSNYRLEPASRSLARASKVKSWLEGSATAKFTLLLMTMLGTSMVIGDGVLTPCISVLSAVGGIKGAASSLTEGRIVSISVAILVCIFLVQRFGTDKVGYSFAPIILVWFLFIGVIGFYNFCKYDPGVIKAFNPKYIIDYFSRNKKDAWISLGGIVLCITGTEAMFADLGHFTVRSIQISMCSVVFPSLILAYTGQASYLRKHNEHVKDTFYKSIPTPLYWPMFVVAVGAAIIASQAMISGTFSIVQQSLAMGCFPRVKVVHTSSKYEGQVFIPEVNYLLMIACVLVTAGFRTTEKIGNAYGIAVVFVMTLTTALVTLVMVMIWKTNIFLILAFVLVLGSVELLYLTSVLYKFTQGGYLPLAFAAFLMTIMSVWSMVHLRKYNYELQHKVPTRNLLDLTTKPEVHRVPGIGLFYSELVEGVPPIFSHYIDNVPAVHKVLVFVSMKWLPIGRVPQDERFLFRRVGPRELGVFRCIVRYGYTDAALVHGEFEAGIVEGLKQYINSEHMWSMGEDGEVVAREFDDKEEVERELREVEKAMSTAVVYLVGQTEVVARSEARWWERVLIDYLYTWLRRNVRQGVEVLRIPNRRMVKVGMTYEL
ncbi:potassium transporter 5 [Amborella trichopoda]|uniref:Potassium transporter n=1 Tax=Amborella trichopoda TaxID=13333 RepID=U5CUH8_AMBTC|nr:potassium transporter 5 [Amborella trichopoda]ERN16966.1 hypothetical protein AMTR_s00057p00200640 [Amborella trichopoda]|eukprot:XP_006855499.1 potassium transporter 5 [Amborella trichopoda]